MAFFLILVLTSCERGHRVDKLRKKYILDDFGLYLERTSPPTDGNPNRYTLDNQAYQIDRRFIFDYFILKKGDTFKITAPKVTDPNVDFQREWGFISKKLEHEDRIETISITVLPGFTNDNQTTLKYEYQYARDPSYNTFSSTSGVIENEMNTWMHPHRDKYFMILELNPFPFIQQPFELGHKWTWNLRIGAHWGDTRWRAWTGSITNEYEYEIIGLENVQTKIGKMDCWIVEATATSSIGSTGLIAYFNEEVGFVKLDYINIDKSRVTIEIKEIR